MKDCIRVCSPSDGGWGNQEGDGVGVQSQISCNFHRKKGANRKLDSTRTDSVRVESVLSMFWVYILLHGALGAMILEAYAGTFYAGRRLWARLCTGHTGPSIASWPGFALAARGQTNPGSHWLAFSVLSKSHIINETIPTYQHSLADSIALRIHQALETLW